MFPSYRGRPLGLSPLPPHPRLPGRSQSVARRLGLLGRRPAEQDRQIRGPGLRRDDPSQPCGRLEVRGALGLIDPTGHQKATRSLGEGVPVDELPEGLAVPAHM